jgi:hypothetical protein
MKSDRDREDYTAPRTPGQAEGTEGDVSGGGSADESAEAPKPSQAEGEEA